MPTFSLTIVSPRGKVLDQAVDSLVAPGQEGELGVLAQHAPMMAGLRAGVTHVRSGDKTLYFATGGGVLEVTRAEVVMLVDFAEAAADVDEAKTQVSGHMDATRAPQPAAKP